MKHILKKSCLPHLTYDNDEIVCSKCGKKIGFRYWYDNDSHLFVFNDFTKYRTEIHEWSYAQRLRKNDKTDTKK